MLASCLSIAVALLAAVPSPPPASPATEADARVTARLRSVEQALEAGEPAAQLWWGGWLFGLTTAAAAQGVASLSVSARAQPLYQVGAVRAAIGAASVVLVPFPAAFAPARLRALPGLNSSTNQDSEKIRSSPNPRAAFPSRR